MRIVKFLYNITKTAGITFVLGLLSCNNNHTATGNDEYALDNLSADSTGASFNKGYDSVSYYRSIELANFWGKKLPVDSLSYPYVAARYKHRMMELVSYMNKTDSVKWIVKKAGRFWYSKFKFREDHPGVYHYVTLLFPMNGEFIAVYTLDEPFNLHEISNPKEVRYLDDTGGDQCTEMIYDFYQENIPLSLDDIVLMNKNKLDSFYKSYDETTTVIKENKQYQAKKYSVWLAPKKVRINSDKRVLIDKDFRYPSFAYYYMHKQARFMINIP